MEASRRAAWSSPQAPVPAQSPWYATRFVATQMCAALSDEIAAATKDRRLVELEAGARVQGKDGPFLYYRFPNAGGSTRHGTAAQLLVDGRSVPVTAFEHEDPADLLLAAPVDLGESIPTAKLEVGLIWLLEALRDRLRGLPSTFNSTLALSSIGASRIPKLGPEASVWDIAPGIDHDVDEDKAAAIEMALRAPVGFVWGPPGTGKTSVVAATTEAHLMHERRVLILTPTNASADEVALRVTQWLERRRRQWGLAPALRPGAVVRFGEADGRVRTGCHTPIVAAKLTPRVMERAKVLVTTLHQAYLRSEFEAAFDVVLVDEAGAATLPQAFWAAGLARRQVTFFGDFRQLGPVIQSETQTAQSWLRRDVFEAAGITEAIERGEDNPNHLAVLKTQYRMHPEISGLVGELFYGRRLKTPREVRDRPGRPCPVVNGAAVTLIDTSGVAYSVQVGERGRTNPVHVDTVQRLLTGMGLDIPSRHVTTGDSVAVLTAYRKQVTLHRSTWGTAFRAKAVRASTVHTYQGGEVDIVVLDLADAPGMELSGFMKARSLIDEGARLFNVSLSRARHHLVVLADVQWLTAKAPRHGITAAFLEAMRDRAEDGRVSWLHLEDLAME